jgi:hypothetical protein
VDSQSVTEGARERSRLQVAPPPIERHIDIDMIEELAAGAVGAGATLSP